MSMYKLNKISLSKREIYKRIYSYDSLVRAIKELLWIIECKEHNEYGHTSKTVETKIYCYDGRILEAIRAKFCEESEGM
jgi:hypothetical protein